EATSNAFPVEMESSQTIGDLKKLIKTEIPDTFNGVDAKDLTLWSVSIPDGDNDDEIPIVLGNVNNKDKKKLRATRGLLEVFPDKPLKNTIHVIVQRPPQVHAPVPSRALTPLPGSLSDGSRPSTPLSGDLHADIKKITDRFFAPGSNIAKFLDAFVKGEGALPKTSGPIRGLPRAWRRGFGKPPETLSFI
ncbi:hypothetical protein BG015_005318, partial [Linnemannia schmuckeri]